ncbi:MAG: dihydroorotate dehydrogenase electron transfer subunit [Tissierellia bacterium]|nr:dihydroorotate dehydrogenase electron transfer subunit [Tissierellia bacterium]
MFHIGKVVENIAINNSRDIVKMTVSLDSEVILNVKPGQFAYITVPGGKAFLKRPISIAHNNGRELVFIYRKVGIGTEELSKIVIGSEIELMVPLGNGYEYLPTKNYIALVGGGVGIPPLWELSKVLKRRGNVLDIYLGFKTKTDIFLMEELSLYGTVYVATEDGSFGYKGFITDVISDVASSKYDCIFGCGPLPMLKEVKKHSNLFTKGLVSLEERMACGFGVCMGCTVDTTRGRVRVCKEGPVFPLEEVFIVD